MKLFIFVCNRPDKLEEILSGFVEVGITGATILESVGMGHVLSRYIPVFAGFQDLLRESRAGNKTIVSVVHDASKVDGAIRIIEEICGPLSESGAGIAFTLAVDDVKGLKPEIS